MTKVAKNELGGDGLDATLDALAREGPRRMIAAALEAEVEAYIERHRGVRGENGRAAVVRHGRGKPPQPTLGLGTVTIEAPRVIDKHEVDGERQKFTSAILPSYLCLRDGEPAPDDGADHCGAREGAEAPAVHHRRTGGELPSQLRRAGAAFGNDVLVTRKDAVPAGEGDLGIIPGSMGARSYIVRGKGNAESFCSCSHGAGRVMSRAEAKRRFTLADHERATQGIECRKDADVIDETPMACKRIGAVMAAQADLVEVVHTLRQGGMREGVNVARLDVAHSAVLEVTRRPNGRVTRPLQ